MQPGVPVNRAREGTMDGTTFYSSKKILCSCPEEKFGGRGPGPRPSFEFSGPKGWMSVLLAIIASALI